MKSISAMLRAVNTTAETGGYNPCNCDEIKMVVWCGISESGPTYGAMLCNATADEDGNDHPPAMIKDEYGVEWRLTSSNHWTFEAAMADLEAICDKTLAGFDI